jgi:uncharacterized protein (UPF0297 family)
MDYKKLIKAFNETKAGFIAFSYTNKKGETSKLLVYVGASYENLKKEDINQLDNFLIGNDFAYVPSEKYTKEIWNEALNELSNSLKNPNQKRSEGQTEAYINVTENGMVKWCVETQKLYIAGSVVRKSVIEEGEYPEVKSKPITIAKNVIKKNYLKSGKIRRYDITNLAGNVKVNGDTIEVE